MTELEAELKRWVEAQVATVHPEIGTSRTNRNGAVYLTFACGGRKEECVKPALVAGNLVALEQFFKYGVVKYIEGLKIEGPSKLYWRQFPNVAFDGTWFQCYARFVVEPA